MKRYGIVGFGCAGYNAARAIRQIDAGAAIHVYDRLADPPFNPMLSTYYAAGRLDGGEVFPFGDLRSIQKALTLDIRSGVTVERADTANRRVEYQGGSEAYDALLIATGASALVPAGLGGGEKVFVMRTLDDAGRLRAHLDAHRVETAAVVGASMVGIKVAELLCERGVQVTVVDAAPHLFPLAAYPSTAHALQETLQAQGLAFRFGSGVVSLEGGVVLAGGEVLAADIVCLCIGTRANLDLVANTRVVEGQLNIGRGIVVDEQMRTSAPGVYAAGDCCEGTNLQTGNTAIIGLWANAGAQGRCAGRNMAGVASRYYGNILHNISHFFNIDFIGLGDPALPGTRLHYGGDGFTVEAVMDAGRLNSVNIVGNYRISGILKNHLTKRLLGEDAVLSPAQCGLLAADGLDRAFIERVGGTS